MNPPKVKPAVMIPLAKPFLPGKWLHPAARAEEYRRPLLAPNPKEYIQINQIGFFIIEQIQTIPKDTRPPIIKVGFGPIL